MKVINQTNKTVISEQIIQPTSLWDQSLGLLKYKTPKAMLFKTRFGIHTFGMRYPIDVIILDNKNRVTVICINMKPNRIFIWNWKYEIVIELPMRTIKKTNTEIGNLISFIS